MHRNAHTYTLKAEKEIQYNACWKSVFVLPGHQEPWYWLCRIHIPFTQENKHFVHASLIVFNQTPMDKITDTHHHNSLEHPEPIYSIHYLHSQMGLHKILQWVSMIVLLLRIKLSQQLPSWGDKALSTGLFPPGWRSWVNAWTTFWQSSKECCLTPRRRSLTFW